MSPLRGLLKDVVTLSKADGRQIDGVRANVQPDVITIDDPSVPIEEGDHLLRVLSNGTQERYLVLDRGFYERVHGIPAHFQAKVRKVTVIASEPPKSVTYNISGPNARVNIGSHDESSNVVNITPGALFERLIATISDGVSDEARRSELVHLAQDMQQAHGGKGFVERYQSFVAAAADHMTLLAPFIPALTQLLK